MSTLASIVLAGGRGRRLAGVTGGIPKQFWAPPGRRSLLEETLERLAPLSDPAHVVTVVDASHRPYVEMLRRRGVSSSVLYQPADRGTATAVLLAASSIPATDENAIVLVTPADHGVSRPEAFRTGVRAAATHVEAQPDDIVLLGVRAAAPVGDYGWIVPARKLEEQAVPVAAFVEKPEPALTSRLFAAGAVWNTMVLVARLGALFGLFGRHAPALAASFDHLRHFRTGDQERQVATLYENLPSTDFSRDVLARARGLQCLSWGPDLGWTDLGTPERLAAWLEQPDVPRPRAAARGARPTASAPMSGSDLGARRLA